MARALDSLACASLKKQTQVRSQRLELPLATNANFNQTERGKLDVIVSASWFRFRRFGRCWRARECQTIALMRLLTSQPDKTAAKLGRRSLEFESDSKRLSTFLQTRSWFHSNPASHLNSSHSVTLFALSSQLSRPRTGSRRAPFKASAGRADSGLLFVGRPKMIISEQTVHSADSCKFGSELRRRAQSTRPKADWRASASISRWR